MKKCAELVEERTLTQQKIDEQVQLTRKKLQRVWSISRLNISDFCVHRNYSIFVLLQQYL